MTAFPPFSNMHELWNTFGAGMGEQEQAHMELWSAMPDSFSGAPQTLFGLGEDVLLNMNGESAAGGT
jgi:hypothetical protein